MCGIAAVAAKPPRADEPTFSWPRHWKLQPGMRESAVAQVTVSEVDAGPMRDILAYLYEQRLEVTPDTLHAIMRAASRLEVAPLRARSAGRARTRSREKPRE